MTATGIKVRILAALIEQRRWRDLIAARYARTSAHTDRVRCSEVAAELADALQIAMSNDVRRRARQAAALAGFGRVVSPGHVPHYCFMRRR